MWCIIVNTAETASHGLTREALVDSVQPYECLRAHALEGSWANLSQLESQGCLKIVLSQKSGWVDFPGLLDSLRVDVYGAKSALKSIASIAVRSAQLLSVTPFDSEVKHIQSVTEIC
jgi:hypothetical protein